MMNRIARGVDQTSGDEYQQVALVSDGHLGTEQPPDTRQVAEEGNLVVNLFHIVTDQSAEDHRLTIPNHDTGHHIAGGKERLLDVVGHRNDVVARGQGNLGAVVDESKEICHLGDE